VQAEGGSGDRSAVRPQASPAAHHHGRLSFRDPLTELPETACRLLLAAKQILASYGYEALTLNAVAATSGENKAMIAYYFGNKAGLVGAVLDSVIHDEFIASKARAGNVATGRRAQHVIEQMRRVAAAADDRRVFVELLPHALRDDTLRRRLALLYSWYWNAKLEWLGVAAPGALDDPDLLGLAQLVSAVIDGLAVQAAIDPDLDLANPYRIFLRMLSSALLPDSARKTDGAPQADGQPPTGGAATGGGEPL